MSSWLIQALIGMILIVPGWIAIPFFGKNFNLSTDLFLAWYFVGGSIGAFVFGRFSITEALPSIGTILSVIILGILICAGANLFIFRSVQNAPNPGLPVAIVNAASIVVFFLTALLALLIPRFFNPVKLDKISLLGTVLTILGATLIAVRN